MNGPFDISDSVISRRGNRERLGCSFIIFFFYRYKGKYCENLTLRKNRRRLVSIIEIYILAPKDQVLKIIFIFILLLLFWQISVVDLEFINVGFFLTKSIGFFIVLN